MKGNHTNHKRFYAREQDLKELKERFDLFITNDFPHLVGKIIALKKESRFQDIKINFILGFVALLLVLVAISLIRGI